MGDDFPPWKEMDSRPGACGAVEKTRVMWTRVWVGVGGPGAPEKVTLASKAEQ